MKAIPTRLIGFTAVMMLAAVAMIWLGATDAAAVVLEASSGRLDGGTRAVSFLLADPGSSMLVGVDDLCGGLL